MKTDKSGLYRYKILRTEVASGAEYIYNYYTDKFLSQNNAATDIFLLLVHM